jgi:hypothetical protein
MATTPLDRARSLRSPDNVVVAGLSSEQLGPLTGHYMHGECRSFTVGHERTRIPQWPRAVATTATFQAGHASSILVTPLHIIAPSQLTFSVPGLFEHRDDKNNQAGHAYFMIIAARSPDVPCQA